MGCFVFRCFGFVLFLKLALKKKKVLCSVYLKHALHFDFQVMFIMSS